MTPAEHRHRAAYATRQHEHFLARARQSQLKAELALARGDLKRAQDWIEAGDRHLNFVADCNDTIDAHMRSVEKE